MEGHQQEGVKGRAIYSNGTSTICDYLQYKGMAKCLVPVASMEDLMQAVFRGAEPRGLYAGIGRFCLRQALQLL